MRRKYRPVRGAEKTWAKGQPVPLEFPEANKLLTKPAGMRHKQCGALPVWSDGEQTISCWRMPLRDRLAIALTGRVWLSVMAGRTQPPVWLRGLRPFVKEKRI